MTDGHSSIHEKPKIFWLILIIFSIGSAFFFTVFGIQHTFGIDEAASVEVASAPPSQIITETTNKTGSPPLYYFILAGWMKLFGINESATRSLSALFYLLAIPAMYVFGRNLYDRKTGLLSAFFYLLSPLAVRTIQNTRMYSLMGLLTILSLIYFFKLFGQNSQSKSDAAKYVLVNTAGTLLHYWFFFILSAEIFCFFLFQQRGNFKKFAVAMALSLALFLFWIPYFLKQMQTQPGAMWWAPEANGKLLLTTFLDFFGVENLGLLSYAAMGALVLFQVDGLKVRLQNLQPLKAFAGQRVGLVLLSLTFVSLLIPWFISQTKPVFAGSKYTIIAFPSFAVFLSALLSRFVQPRLLLPFCFLLLGGAVTGYAYQKTRFHEHTDKSTAEFLINAAADGDVWVFGGSSRSVLEYYLRLRKPVKRFVKISFPAEMEKHSGWSNPTAMLANKPELEKEADSLSNYLQATLDGKTRIWLIYGYYREIEEIVKDSFDRTLQLENEIILKEPYCTFYDRIRIYRKRPV